MASVYQLLFFPVLFLLKLFVWASLRDVDAVSWSQNKWPHDLLEYSDNSVLSVTQNIPSSYADFNNTLDNILKVRVPGTEAHQQVKEYIVKSMKDLGWTVEEDHFTSQTPVGKKPFTNIAAFLNPNACRFLVLACHYDSKLSSSNKFVGATDSAVPCTMMIHLAKMLRNELQQNKEKSVNLSLQFLFFDGEEALRTWTRTDSLYGSRHLADKWNKTPYLQGRNVPKQCVSLKKDNVSFLDQMDAMVLLDLIGAANPRFYSYFGDTHALYSRFVDIENKLNDMKQMESHPPRSRTQYFNSQLSYAGVEDDHIPFLRKGVPIVHLIPNPFPDVWHKDSDNKAHLHHPTINNLNKVLCVFVAEYLHLSPQKKS